MLMVWWWTGLDRVPLWLAIVGNCALFATIAGRRVSTMALMCLRCLIVAPTWP
jgi:hypothetical protein